MDEFPKAEDPNNVYRTYFLAGKFSKLEDLDWSNHGRQCHGRQWKVYGYHTYKDGQQLEEYEKIMSHFDMSVEEDSHDAFKEIIMSHEPGSDYIMICNEVNGRNEVSLGDYWDKLPMDVIDACRMVCFDGSMPAVPRMGKELVKKYCDWFNGGLNEKSREG